MIRYLGRVVVVGVFACSCLLAGCADLGRWMGSVWPASDNGCRADLVLRECRQIAALPAAEQRRQVRRLQASFDEHGGDLERFVLACLAVHPKSRFQDHGKALQLLQGYRRRTKPQEDLLALGELLEELLQQQQRTEQRLSEEQQRAESLASKLKALEDIEKIIQEREKKALPSP